MPRKIILPFCDELCHPMPRRKRTGNLAIQKVVPDPAWDAEWKRRFGFLLAHYHVDPNIDNDWGGALLTSLVLDFVPGLTEAKETRRGRPRTKSTPAARTARSHLLELVEAKKEANPHLSDVAACRSISKDWRKSPPPHVLSTRPAGYLSRQLAMARRERAEAAHTLRLARALMNRSSCFPLPPIPRSSILLGSVGPEAFPENPK